jgi:hypothetical protein
MKNKNIKNKFHCFLVFATILICLEIVEGQNNNNSNSDNVNNNNNSHNNNNDNTNNNNDNNNNDNNNNNNNNNNNIKTLNLFSTHNCSPNDITICWPKCCFENQVFNLQSESCEQADESIILTRPDVFSLRYIIVIER